MNSQTRVAPAYRIISAALHRIANLDRAGNTVQASDVVAGLERWIKAHAPSGSGFDRGTSLVDSSKPDRIVLRADFHHMDGNGFYCGWSEHMVVLTPTFLFGVQTSVTGRDMRDIKSYIQSTFHHWASTEFPDPGLIESTP